MRPLADLSLEERLRLLGPKPCRPLPDGAAAIKFALERFNATWSQYRSITPTLYPIRRQGRGSYVTLGQLRRSFGLSQATLEAVLEALDHQMPLDGFLLAAEAVGGEPPRLLFALQGHDQGERHYGGLELATLTPFEHRFVTEFDVAAEDWQDLRLQAQNA